ncbi:hypothetical protein JCM10207_000906 [Rhodosporidiobolus poonsookiae]
MHLSSALAAAVAAASGVYAFQGTYPVVAWSSEGSSSLASLSSPSSSAASRSSSTSQQTFSTAVEPQDELCALSHLVVFSAPGLHYSDLARLPASASSPSGIKAALAHFGRADTPGHALTTPYVAEKGASPAARLVRRFVQECGATVETEAEKQLWSGEAGGKTVRVVKLEGLERWALVGAEAGRMRARVMGEIDAAVAAMTTALPRPFAVVLTALPSSYKTPRCARAAAARQLSKRQAITEGDGAVAEEEVDRLLDEMENEEGLEGMLDRIEAFEEEQAAEAEAEAAYDGESSDLGVTDVAEPVSSSSEADPFSDADEDPYTVGDWDADSLLDVSPYQQQGNDTAGNGTSIFEPKEGAGLLHRYVFFSPALIFALLVSFLVLIPTLLVGTQALLSIETLQGLETKMAGSVGIDPSKQ